jgi:hypothetical protein
VDVLAYILFFVAGVGFGFAAPGRYKLLPLLFPLALALGAIVRDGIDGEVLLRLLIALVVTVAGIAIGRLLDERAQRSDHTRYA